MTGFDPKTDCDEFPAGAAAFRDAQPDTANPYPPLTTEHELWLDGWWYALDMREKTHADKDAE